MAAKASANTLAAGSNKFRINPPNAPSSCQTVAIEDAWLASLRRTVVRRLVGRVDLGEQVNALIGSGADGMTRGGEAVGRAYRPWDASGLRGHCAYACHAAIGRCESSSPMPTAATGTSGKGRRP